MEETPRITPPSGENDTDGAFSVFEGFLVIYQPAFLQVEHYLEKAMQEMAPVYAEAYRLWYKAAHDLIFGVLLMTNHRPLPDPESFMEAVRLYSFDSAIRFLQDICITSNFDTEADWSERFRENIDTLFSSAMIL